MIKFFYEKNPEKIYKGILVENPEGDCRSHHVEFFYKGVWCHEIIDEGYAVVVKL